MRRATGTPARGFVDRREAGRALGDALMPLAGEHRRDRLLVLGLARGGVVVAAEVARTLGAALDVCVVRKIGSPHQPELAIGAVGPDGVRIVNHSLIHHLGITDESLDRMTTPILASRDTLERELRGDRPAPDLAGKIVILVEDGLATGASMRAAVEYAHRAADSVVIAVPTAAPDVVGSFEALGYQTVALITSPRFGSVGQWYKHFEEVSSATTRAILEKAWRHEARE